MDCDDTSSSSSSSSSPSPSSSSSSSSSQKEASVSDDVIIRDDDDDEFIDKGPQILQDPPGSGTTALAHCWKEIVCSEVTQVSGKGLIKERLIEKE